MAKSKSTVNVDVSVKGKGTQKTALEMKNLGTQADKAAAGTDNFNRGLKGVSKQSSGASKNFSKMSQGMGGIVGSYAVLAANIFAIGAAFRFLQSAGDLQKLKEGQILYASATGVALRSLTNDIIAATDAQITFSDASQASAIGIAAGLTTDQLVKLGKGAKDVSIILGRDVTDSFNRLVRGVTKAEPELLDELGIILRLADASEKYASSIGKTAQDLTQFEKSQAVTVEVLSQLESKYGRIMAIMEPEGNQFTKLGKAFDDIVNTIKEVAAFVAGPVAAVLTKVPALAIGILAAFANSLINTGLSSWADNAALSADKMGASYKTAGDKFKAFTKLKEIRSRHSVDATAGVTAAAERGNPFKTEGAIFKRAAAGTKLSVKDIKAVRKAIQDNGHAATKMGKQWETALVNMENKTKGFAAKVKFEFANAGLSIKKAGYGIYATWKMALAGISRAAAATGAVLAAAMSVLSWVSIIATLGTVVYQFFKTEEAVDEVEKKVSDATNKVTALNEEFENFNEIQKIIIEDGSNMLDFFEALSNRIGQLGVGTQATLFENMKETVGDMLRTPLNEAREEIDRLESDFFSTWTAASSAFSGGRRMIIISRYSEAVDELEVLEERLQRLQRGGYADPGRRVARVSTGQLSGRQDREELEELSLQQIQPGGEFHEEQLRDTESAIARLKPIVDSTSQAMRILEGNVIEFMAASDDPALSQLGLHFKDLLVSQELMNNKFSGTNPITEYFALLNKLTDARSWERQEIQLAGPVKAGEEAITRLETTEDMFLRITKAITAGQVASDEYHQSLSQAQRMATDNAQEVDKILLDVQKRSTEGRMEDTLLDEYRNRVKLVFNEEITRQEAALEVLQTSFQRATGIGSEPRPNMSPEFANQEEQDTWGAENEALIRQITLFDRLDRMKDESKQRSLDQTLAESRALVGTTKLVGARIKLEATLDKQENKRLDLLDEKLNIENKITEFAVKSGNLAWEGEEQQQRRLQQLETELEISENITEETERRLKVNMQIFDAANQSLETGLTKGISALIKGEEASVKDTMLKIAEGVLGSVADTLSEQFTDFIMKTGPLSALTKGGQIVHDKIVEAFKKVQPSKMTGSAAPGSVDSEGNPVGPTIPGSAASSEKGAGIWEKLFGKKVEGPTLNSDGPQMSNLEAGQEQGNYENTSSTRTASIFGPVISSFENLFAGEGPFLSRLGDFFSGDSSFLKGLGSMLGKLGGMFGDLLTGGSEGGGLFGLIATAFGAPAAAANGAIFKGGFRKYANGGIVNSPTLGLIGEGRHNEAVVPLPNGKAIPVDMRNNSQSNNITVNVSADGQTQTEGGQDSDGLGRAIAKAVQEELQNQKRAGGILNKYGTA